MRDFARVVRMLRSLSLRKIIQFGDPILHVHGPMAARLQFGKVKISGDNQVQYLQLFLVQVILGDRHIGFAHCAMRRVLPTSQPHVRLERIGTLATISAAVCP